MLVQYEDTNQPPPLTSTWSWQDSKGSGVLILLAWIGLAVGFAGALYWAHLSVLGALFGTAQWPGYVWLALTAAGAAIIAPVMWPFLETRRPAIANFVLGVGVVCWLITSASGTLYLIGREKFTPLPDFRSAIAARHDCSAGLWQGCSWLESREGRATLTRIRQFDDDRSMPTPPAPIKLIMIFRHRLLLLATVALGGCIALAMIWGPAEALKAMYSEPGALVPKIDLPAYGLPVPALGAPGNPIDLAADAWARQCLEAARGERVMLATLHAHYRGWCIQRGMPTMTDEAFGRFLNRQRDPGNPSDLGGPMTRFGAFPHKTGGRMEYIGARIVPDRILDDIEGGEA